MDGPTMVVVIVLVSCLAGAYNNHLKTKRQTHKAGLSDDTLAELDDLRERVEVLEKIVTDDRYHLSRELNELERRA